MVKIRAQKKEVEGKTFYFLEIGRREHGRPDMILWVSSKLVKVEEGVEYIEFPIRNAKIISTEKGTLVLRPMETWNTFYVFTPAGYRGESEIQILYPQGAIICWFKRFESPQGNLGISEGALVSSTATKVIWNWRRTGRLYGAPANGITISDISGEEKTIEGIEELQELQELSELID